MILDIFFSPKQTDKKYVITILKMPESIDKIVLIRLDVDVEIIVNSRQILSLMFNDR